MEKIVLAMICALTLTLGACEKRETKKPTDVKSPEAAGIISDRVPQSVVDLATGPLTDFGKDKIIVAAVKTRNAEGKTKAEIQELDKQWQAAKKEGKTEPFMKAVMENPCAKQLKKLMGEHPFITEIFVTDNQGANVCQTGMTGDYWQGDEAKFKEVFKKGILVSHPEVEDGMNITQVSVPVLMGKRHIGTMTIGVNIDKVPAPEVSEEAKPAEAEKAKAPEEEKATPAVVATAEEVMEKGKEEVVEPAKEVAEEAAAEVKEEVIEPAKEVAEEAVAEVKEEVIEPAKEVAEEAVAEVKEEVVEPAKEMVEAAPEVAQAEPAEKVAEKMAEAAQAEPVGEPLVEAEKATQQVVEAQEQAEEATKELESLPAQVEKIQQEAEEVKQEVEKVAAQVKMVSEKVQKVSEESRQVMDRARKAMEKVVQARAQLRDAAKQIQKAAALMTEQLAEIEFLTGEKEAPSK